MRVGAPQSSSFHLSECTFADSQRFSEFTRLITKVSGTVCSSLHEYEFEGKFPSTAFDTADQRVFRW